MIPRRSPGQRRRRTRRGEELDQIESIDPAKHAELLELRRYNPQAFRKELMRLTRKGVIRKGRAFEVPEDLLSTLSLPVPEILEAIEAGLERGDYSFRAIGGLLEAERSGAGREALVEALGKLLEGLLSSESRALR